MNDILKGVAINIITIMLIILIIVILFFFIGEFLMSKFSIETILGKLI